MFFVTGSGLELLRDPRYNKGLAFSDEERDHHYLRGLLPRAIISQELQASHDLLQTPLFYSLSALVVLNRVRFWVGGIL